jgi:hypothetical protein
MKTVSKFATLSDPNASQSPKRYNKVVADATIENRIRRRFMAFGRRGWL